MATLCYTRRYTFLYVFHNPFVLSPLADMIVVFFIFHYINSLSFHHDIYARKKGKHKKIQLLPWLVFCRAKLQNFLLKYNPFPQNFPMKKIEKNTPLIKWKRHSKKLGRLQQSIFTTLLSQFFGSKKKEKQNLEFEKKRLLFKKKCRFFCDDWMLKKKN